MFRWFIGLSIDDEVWNHSTLSKNRDRLLDYGIIPVQLEEVIKLARKRDLLSEDHFSVDGTLILSLSIAEKFIFQG